MRHEVKVDVAIIGGGVAGLWLLNRLKKQGYSAILFEQKALGSEQTIASQGMIHGGLKYALGGLLNGASEAVADMPQHWRDCLDGQGEIDLSQTQLLSKQFNLWSTGSAGSKLTSFFATKAMRGRIDKLKRGDFPEAFQNDAFKGNVYSLVDIVVDVPSLLSNLQSNCPDATFNIDWQHASWQQGDNGRVEALCINHGDDQIAITAQQYVLTAGRGNGALMEMLNIRKPKMQIRPLQQVMVKHHNDLELYAHCVDLSLNSSPRLTISSHRSTDGRNVWSLGGDLATNGIDDSPEQLIEAAKQELATLFPWLDFSDAEWSTITVDRAEPKQNTLTKPDQAFAEVTVDAPNVTVAWPTKLTLAPNLADTVIEQLEQKAITPTKATNADILASLGTPEIARPIWETEFAPKDG
ncbi:glycerol-3-phosphate dehydrogenase [Sinobacterium caligoides]|uniref:Glycerol-3-phosphate dehydrogenase n=1 Tax=Sinobacterium caligoides TaxID=933926 RepID=A0A3N2DHF3_9GAMM|nr:FAD-dependent oxidoreductase [Sinobacterium caligoides]ROR98814.1 glycerol-3-phosphate dehydrogenase [Sinobacterium caligoides]